MSLLLDALHRASKDKEKAALAAANAAAAESFSEGKLVLSAPATKVVDFPDLVPMASVTEVPVPAAVRAPDPVVTPVAMAEAKPLELSLEMELETPPAVKLTAQALEETPAIKTVSPALESYAAAAKMTGAAVPRRLDPQAAAAAIQSAYAAPVFTRVTAPNRRPAVLAGIAAVLGLAFASFGFGLWGDPEKLLGLQSSSSLVPAVAVQPVPSVPADPASAAVVATQGAPVAGDPPPPAQEPLKPTVAATTITPAPRPLVVASVTSSVATSAAGPVALVVVPGPKKAETEPKEPVLRAAPVAPVFAARARAQTALEVGYAALLSGRFDDASRSYGVALDANPGEPDALLGMAYIAHTKGQRDEAQSYYRRVLRQDPGNSVANAGLVALEAGASGSANGTTQGERARELAVRQPESAAVQSLAATALVQEGALPDAALAFARAQALEPNNPLYTYNLAVALDKLGSYAQAAVQYERALRVNSAAATPLGPTQANAARVRASQLRQSLGLSPEVTP